MKSFITLLILSVFISAHAIAESLEFTGMSRLSKVKDINKQVHYNGNFQLKDSQINSINGNGMVKVSNSTVKTVNTNGMVILKKSKSDQITIKGSGNFKDSEIKRVIIESQGKVLRVENSKIDKILVENSTEEQTIQVISSKIGEIEFKSKKGKVEHDKSSKINTLIGGTQSIKDSKSLKSKGKNKKLRKA